MFVFLFLRCFGSFCSVGWAEVAVVGADFENDNGDGVWVGDGEGRREIRCFGGDEIREK